MQTVELMQKVKFEIKHGTLLLQFQAEAAPIIKYFIRCFEGGKKGDEYDTKAQNVIDNLQHRIDNGKHKQWFSLVLSDTEIKYENAETDDLFTI